MNKTDNLFHNQLIVKCNSAIALLDQDIADIETLKSKLNSIIKEGKLKGQSIIALKENLRDYFVCIGLILSADKSDKNDLKSLKSKLATQTDYDGPKIWYYFEEAKRKMQAAEEMASDYRKKERSYSPPWYYDEELDKWLQSDDPNPYTSKVRHYEDIADTERKIMESAQRKMKAFDSFAADTKGYLSAGKEIRKTVSETFALMKTQKEGGIYSPGVAKVYLEKLLLSDNSYLKKIANGIIGSEEYGEYLIDSEFYDDEDVKELELINSQIDSYYNMLNSGNTAAIEAAKKNMNLNDLLSRKAQVIEKIVSNMNHSEEFSNALYFAKLRNYSADQMEELMWNWAKIDDMDISKCELVPKSWIDELDHNYKMSKWIAVDNPIMSYYYYATYMDYYAINSIINGDVKLLNEMNIEINYSGRWYKDIFSESISGLSSDNKLLVKYDSLYNNLPSNLGEMAKELLSDKNLTNKFINGLANESVQFVWIAGLIAETTKPIGFNSLVSKDNTSALISNMKVTQANANVAWKDFWKCLMKDFAGVPNDKMNTLYTQLSQIPVLSELSKSKIDSQYEKNVRAWDDYKRTFEPLMDDSLHSPYVGDGKLYIENQHDFEKNIFYGNYIPLISEIFMTGKEDGKKVPYYELGKGLYGAHNSCEVVAVYNVMTFLEDDKVDFPQIVKDFASKSPVFGGNLGTSPDCIEEYLNMRDYKTEVIDVESLYYDPNGEDDFDTILEKYDAFIITDWNTEYADDAIHTMAITVKKEINASSGEMKYTIVRHNDFKDEEKNFSIGYTSDDLYKYLCMYTDTDSGAANDGVIKVIGVNK